MTPPPPPPGGFHLPGELEEDPVDIGLIVSFFAVDDVTEFNENERTGEVARFHGALALIGDVER